MRDCLECSSLSSRNEKPVVRRGEVFEVYRGVDQEPRNLPCFSQSWSLYGFRLSALTSGFLGEYSKNQPISNSEVFWISVVDNSN